MSRLLVPSPPGSPDATGFRSWYGSPEMNPIARERGTDVPGPPPGEKGKDRSTVPGNRSRILAALAYALGGFTGVILLALRREDRFVQFHALQSIGATVVALGVSAILWLFSNFPLLGFLYAMLFRLYQIFLFILWLGLLWNAYRGRWSRLPGIGRWAEKEVR